MKKLLLLFALLSVPAVAQVSYSPAVSAMLGEVTQAGLTSDLNTIVAFGSRLYTQTGNDDALQYALERLQATGLTTTDHTFSFSGGGLGSHTIHYVDAVKLGTGAPTEIVLVEGHCDSKPLASPGANDNGTGCEAVLRFAEICASRSFNRTIRFLIVNGEEYGSTDGSDSAGVYAAANSTDNFVAVINVDTIGLDQSDNQLYVLTHTLGGTNYAAEAAIYTTASQVNTAYSLGLTVTQYANSATLDMDHTGFWLISKPAVSMFSAGANAAVPQINHSANDDVAHMNLPFYTVAAKVALGTLAHTAGVLEGRKVGGGHNVGGGRKVQ